jgi:hypothetical protein
MNSYFYLVCCFDGGDLFVVSFVFVFVLFCVSAFDYFPHISLD